MNSKTYLRIRDEVSTPFSVRANYYVEYRSALNGDVLLAASAANKVRVLLPRAWVHGSCGSASDLHLRLPSLWCTFAMSSTTLVVSVAPRRMPVLISHRKVFGTSAGAFGWHRAPLVHRWLTASTHAVRCRT